MISFRFINETIVLIERLGTVYVTWTTIVVCVLLLRIQMEIVQYFIFDPIMNLHLKNQSVNSLFWSYFLVECRNWFCKFNNNCSWRMLHFFSAFLRMWTWTTRFGHLQFDHWCYRSVWLVFAPISYEANAYQNFNKCPEASWFDTFWEYGSQSWCFQEGCSKIFI